MAPEPAPGPAKTGWAWTWRWGWPVAGHTDPAPVRWSIAGLRDLLTDDVPAITARP